MLITSVTNRISFTKFVIWTMIFNNAFLFIITTKSPDQQAINDGSFLLVSSSNLNTSSQLQ